MKIFKPLISWITIPEAPEIQPLEEEDRSSNEPLSLCQWMQGLCCISDLSTNYNHYYQTEKVELVWKLSFYSKEIKV